MAIANFSLEFDLNTSEIRKLNKMYFKDIYQKKILFFLILLLLTVVTANLLFLSNDNDWGELLIGNLFLILFFLLFQYAFVDAICKLIFSLIKRLLKFEYFISKYKFNFTNSLVYIHSPLGEFAHKWSHIEKAILTKDFLFLYFKDKNGYIISISNKYNSNRKMEELIAFVEKNVTHITKI